MPFQAEVAIGCTMVSLVSGSIVPQAMEEQSKLAERIIDHVADALISTDRTGAIIR